MSLPNEAPDANESVEAILRDAKRLAQRYRRLTGRPLGITGEIAEFEASRILRLTLTPVRQAGVDATEERDGRTIRYQIKGRCLSTIAGRGRLGAIDVQSDFDAVLLVMLDENLDATEIREAPREAVVAALTAPGSKSRNDRGQLGLSKFRAISIERWRSQQVR